MFFLALLPPLPVLGEALLDALLLSVMILPVLYVFLFRPIAVHILQREQAEAAYRNSEERYRQLTDNIREVFWLSSADLRQLVYVSPEYETIWGRTCESLYSDPASFLDSIYPEDRERIIAAFPKQLCGEFAEEYRIVQPHGGVRWIRVRALSVRNERAEVYRIAGFAEDITDRKQAEEELLTSQVQLQSLVAELLLTKERERRTLATDLHDSIAQVLALAKLKLTALRVAASCLCTCGGLGRHLRAPEPGDSANTVVDLRTQSTGALPDWAGGGSGVAGGTHAGAVWSPHRRAR